jgi:3,4-dihydroxy-2-butanone 4-phosphate synthase
MADPNLAPVKKAALVNELMKARSAVRLAKLAGRQIEEAAAHHAVVREMVRLEGQPASRRILMRIARRKTEIFVKASDLITSYKSCSGRLSRRPFAT